MRGRKKEKEGKREKIEKRKSQHHFEKARRTLRANVAGTSTLDQRSGKNLLKRYHSN